MALHEDDSVLDKLELACSDLKNLLQTSAKMDESLEQMDKKFDRIDETLSTALRRVAPLQSLAMATKSLDTRINRAVTPALALLDSFRLSESLQDKLLELSSSLSAEETPRKRLKKLLKYLDCVDQLNVVINAISQDGEPVIQKLQEVVEFLSMTKATDQYRMLTLRETLITLKALYETEVDAMKFDGLLDEALLNMQDEYESILLCLKHQNIGELQVDEESEIASDLGTDLEIEVLQRISGTLAANNCLDICIGIFVKVRYRRAAKALMRLNPEYLRTRTQEEIDEMEWETLETAITIWIQHLEVVVKTMLIADKIMAVFFRFEEAITRSKKEPYKLFKFLDMFDSLEKFKLEFSNTFYGEVGANICTQSKVFWEFGLKIEGNSDGLPPPQDGSVLKLVRYAINFLKYLATENYRAPTGMVLRREQIWKAGIRSKPEIDDDLLKYAITNIMDALKRKVESKRSRHKDNILPHIFAINTYWYIYMRTRSIELGLLLGEPFIRDTYKAISEELAYIYKKQAWGPLVRRLDREDLKRVQSKEAIGSLARLTMENFMKGLDEISEQIKKATVKLVMPAYSNFVNTLSAMFQGKLYVSPQPMQLKRRDFKDRVARFVEREIRGFRRSRSNTGEV
ncbi:hypothetical protein I3842_07G176700 [Carya illinoinensis]|uniref:Exocyst subunit Exo70 family protein n=1 Tax=Carya illinoinensis TaxID=32201 RepID=A0A922JF56_CARIL|nr:hypothetical protein I3842_07G176700 [Carya illinoinensis]